MKTIIQEKEYRVVYIEYGNHNLPHQVYTAVYSPHCIGAPCWILMGWWDFFANEGDINDLKIYNAGGGGKSTEIPAPHWIDGYIGSYWIDDKIAAFKGIPINAQQLKHPRLIKTKWNGNSRNPFKVSDETYSSEYCEVCDHESTEICDQHQYIDNDGELRYKHAHGHGYNY